MKLQHDASGRLEDNPAPQEKYMEIKHGVGGFDGGTLHNVHCTSDTGDSH